MYLQGCKCFPNSGNQELDSVTKRKSMRSEGEKCEEDQRLPQGRTCPTKINFIQNTFIAKDDHHSAATALAPSYVDRRSAVRKSGQHSSQNNCTFNLYPEMGLQKYDPNISKFEVQGGKVMRSCGCLRKNGLQDQCMRSKCGGRPECLVTPLPTCEPSGGAYLLQLQRDGRKLAADSRGCIQPQNMKPGKEAHFKSSCAMGQEKDKANKRASRSVSSEQWRTFPEVVVLPEKFLAMEQRCPKPNISTQTICTYPISCIRHPKLLYHPKIGGLPTLVPIESYIRSHNANNKQNPNPTVCSVPRYCGMSSPQCWSLSGGKSALGDDIVGVVPNAVDCHQYVMRSNNTLQRQPDSML